MRRNDVSIKHNSKKKIIKLFAKFNKPYEYQKELDDSIVGREII